jgi:hypothetical protein
MSTTAEPPFDVTHNFRHIKGKRQIHSQEYRWAYNIILCDYIIYFCADMWCVSRMHCNIYRFWHKDPQSKAHSFFKHARDKHYSHDTTGYIIAASTNNRKSFALLVAQLIVGYFHSSMCLTFWTLTFVLRRVVPLKKVLTQTFHLTLP